MNDARGGFTHVKVSSVRHLECWGWLGERVRQALIRPFMFSLVEAAYALEKENPAFLLGSGNVRQYNLLCGPN